MEKKFLAFISTSCLIFVLFFLVLFLKNQSINQIHFLNIPLGDAIFIQTEENKNILIDTGSNDALFGELGKFLSPLNQSIDILVLTHADQDHIGAAVSLIKRFNVKEIWWTGAESSTPVFTTLKKELLAKKIPYRILFSQKDFLIENNILFDTLYPIENISFLPEHGNNESLVFKLSLYGKSILFTGDLEDLGEKELLASGENLQADILKVAHHGSKTSSSEDFIDAVHPKIAIAQAALENPFGHPHKEVVERFLQNTIEFLQTGKTGTLSFCISKKKKEFYRCN